MIGAISSVTQAQPVTQPPGTSTQNASQPKQQSADSGGDSVQLSKAAQEKTGCSGH